MTLRHASRRIAALTGLLVLTAACGGGDDDDAATDATEAEAEETTTTAEETTTTEAEAEDVTEPVTTTYLAFFDGFSGDLALLEDGEAFAADIEAMRARSEAAGGITVDVKEVTALDETGCENAGVASPCAEVLFDLVVAGTPAVPDQVGYAIEVDGEWLVAKTTFCSLASLGSGLPPACNE